MKLLPLFVIIPLASAFIISLIGKKARGSGDVLSVLATVSLTGLSLFSVKLAALHNVIVYKVGGWTAPLGICMVLDGLTSFMLVTVNVVSLAVAVYSLDYMRRYTDRPRFFVLFMLMLAGLNGVVITGDLFNLFVFLEIASIASYALVAFGVEAQDLEASFKYAVMGTVASGFILLAIAFLYSHTSTLNMADMSFALANSNRPSGALVNFVAVLLLAGFGIKAAIMPFHAWLPDAHPSAPAPISAMLSGVFIKVLGVYALCRVFFNILSVSGNILFTLMFLGIISQVAGAFLAIAQKDIKRMFAYSSISQIGYIIFALGIGTPLAVLGALFHLFNHAVGKSLLFLNSGAIEYSTGTRDLRELGGLNNRMPVSGFTGVFGAMSISGIPPFAGFWSKLIIILAAIQAGYLGFAAVAILVSVVTLVYYLKFLGFSFFGRLSEKLSGIREVPFKMKIAMVFLAAICLLGGLLMVPACKSFLGGASAVLMPGDAYKYAVLGALK